MSGKPQLTATFSSVFKFLQQNLKLLTLLLARFAVIKGVGTFSERGFCLNEDDFFKRGLLSYVFVTATLWFMAWIMEANGVASVRNPAWQLISGLRSIFTWIGLIVIGAFLGISAVVSFYDAQTTKKNAIREADKRRQAALDAEADRAREREERHAQAQKLTREKRELEEVHRKILQKKKLQKQQRSAEEAARSALDDF